MMHENVRAFLTELMGEPDLIPRIRAGAHHLLREDQPRREATVEGTDLYCPRCGSSEVELVESKDVYYKLKGIDEDGTVVFAEECASGDADNDDSHLLCSFCGCEMVVPEMLDFRDDFE